MKKKYPDNIVYDEEMGYNSNVLPYGTNVGAPAIKMEDISTWKSISVNKVNKQLSSKFNELKEENLNLTLSLLLVIPIIYMMMVKVIYFYH